MTFDVLVVNGIHYEDIVAFAIDGFSPLKIVRVAVGESRWRYSVSLTKLPQETAVALVVPDCFAPINVFGDDKGLERRSFLAAGWELAEAAAGSHTSADVSSPPAIAA